VLECLRCGCGTSGDECERTLPGYSWLMQAVTWHGKRDVRVDNVPDPGIEQPTDVVIHVTSTGICGSDLHLYEIFGPFLAEGDILGHEAMGIVEEVGPQVTALAPGGCTGRSPAGRPSTCGCPSATPCLSRCRTGRRTNASSTSPTSCPPPGRRSSTPRYPPGGSLVVLGLGPIGEMAARVALHGAARQVIGVDLVPERLARAADRGCQTLDLRAHDKDLADVVREMTGGRGPDSVIDAVGMESHGAPTARLAQQAVSLLPDRVAAPLMKRVGVDRLHALYLAIDIVRRGGTISLAGVYGGMADAMPMLALFDKQIQLRMGQANVHRWVPEILPLLTDGDPLGVEGFASHQLPLRLAPQAYEMFQHKQDGAVKILLRP
jgi:threonine dehydrogenase-like Zn-dependent dehydrogenase